ncbi:MAG: glycosyltransferase family 4 protein [Acidimicrobiia bacterium]
MRLGINGWRAGGRLTGVGRYLVNVVSRWGAEVVDDPFDAITLYSDREIDPDGVVIPASIRRVVMGPAAPMLVWENLRLGPATDSDVLFCPSYTRPLLTRARTVVVTHDLAGVVHPECFSRRQSLYNLVYRASATHATVVLTSTEVVRSEIIRHWGVPPGRTRVVPLAAAEVFRPLSDRVVVEAARERFVGAGQPYFLFVGKTTGRRQVPMLMEAFARFRESGANGHRLLLVGPRPSFDLQEVAVDLGVAESVVHAGFVPDEDLNALYNGCEALVCPSVYETVSFPIMEAQAAGAPVICLDAPGPREITAGAAELMPHLSAATLTEAMQRVVTDPTLRRELIEAGLTSARRFSWERTSRETLRVLAEAGTTT